jgi:capsular polysaccharide transport system ATP-binding protein
MLKLDHVSKNYATSRGSHRVLDDVCLEVRKGEKWGVLGRNGSGKSTLVRLMAGATQPTAGEIVREMSVSWPLAFGGAFQGSLTGYDNIRFICRVYGADFQQACERVEAFSELGRFLNEPVKTFSSGMRARFAFGLSLAVDFDCILVDEVVSVGDVRFHAKCARELFETREDRALVIVSHDESYVLRHCTQFGVMLSGRFFPFSRADDAYRFYREH